MNSLFASEPLTKYNWTTMVVDVAIGIVTFILVIPVALYLGGFSFFTPWAIALIPLFFLCGFLRGASPERIWAKACAISAGAHARGSSRVGCQLCCWWRSPSDQPQPACLRAADSSRGW